MKHLFDSLLDALGAAFTYLGEKEKKEYSNRLMALQKEYYEEFNKTPDVRSDAELDRIEYELCNLASGFAAYARTQNA